jgi:hypothetical protein
MCFLPNVEEDVDKAEASQAQHYFALTFDITEADIKQKERFRVQYLSKVGKLSVQKKSPPKHEKVIIFDWDDTLLCTTFLRQFGEGKQLPSAVKHHLRRIEETVAKILEMALDVGRTFIVTNAMEGWVEESAALYMPKLLNTLEKVPIISARSTQASKGSSDIREWKKGAFLELGRQFDRQSLTSLISIGDSQLEHIAATALTKTFDRCFLKTVKLQEMPSPKELVSELDVIREEFQKIVCRASDLKLRLARK